jgi:hypothetical protein
MIQRSGNGLFAVKTQWFLSQNNFSNFFVIRIVFSAFYSFHKKSLFFFKHFCARRGERKRERRRIPHA